jgi:regulator of RNase E activity RraB
MATITQGTITVQVPDLLQPPPEAGKLSPNDIKRIPRARRGVGQLCTQAAEALERAGVAFAPPPGITAQSLRDASTRADGIGAYIIDIEVIRKTLKQANLLFHADAWKQVRQVNDQIKSQVKHNPALAVVFQQVLQTFASYAPTVSDTDDEEDEEDDEDDEEDEVDAPPPAG